MGWDSDFGMLARQSVIFSRQEQDLTFIISYLFIFSVNQNKTVMIQVITGWNWDINARNLDITDINQVINVRNRDITATKRNIAIRNQEITESYRDIT